MSTEDVVLFSSIIFQVVPEPALDSPVVYMEYYVHVLHTIVVP